MQGLHWRTLACLQGTSKLKINPAAAGRQAKETQSKRERKKRGQKNKRIMPDDIHMNINLACTLKNIIIFIEREKR